MHAIHPKWLMISLLPISVSFTTPAIQAAEPPQSAITVVNSTLMDVKIKRLGEPVKVHYSLKTSKQSDSYDVYLAYFSATIMDTAADKLLLFIQPSGNFTTQPTAYYTNISSSTEDTILDFVLPSDLSLVGEHYFYAALIKVGTDLSHLAPINWPWEKLSTDTVFVSR